MVVTDSRWQHLSSFVTSLSLLIWKRRIKTNTAKNRVKYNLLNSNKDLLWAFCGLSNKLRTCFQNNNLKAGTHLILHVGEKKPPKLSCETPHASTIIQITSALNLKTLKGISIYNSLMPSHHFCWIFSHIMCYMELIAGHDLAIWSKLQQFDQQRDCFLHS